MKTDAVLGIDVGTTAIKAMLLTADGRPRPAHAVTYSLQSPNPGWFEQNPDDMCAAIVKAVRAAVQGAAQSDADVTIRGIGLSTQAAATLLLDSQGQPLTPIISWMDGRTAEMRRALTQQVGQDAIRTATGRNDAGILAPLVKWLAEHRSGAFERATTVSTVEDFVCRWLTGVSASDATNAAITGLLNLSTVDWDTTLAQAAGLDVGLLPPLRKSSEVAGRLTPTAAKTLALPKHVPVCVPLHDQHAAALGAGVLTTGQAVLSTGTAWVVFMRTDDPRRNLGGRLFRAPAIDRAIDSESTAAEWGVIDALAAGNGYYDRAMTWLGLQPNDYTQAERLAGDADPLAGGLCFLPTLNDERAAAWTGLSLSHQRGDLLRSVMNGLACEAVLAAKTLAGDAPLRELVMLGGAARSALWPRIVAAVAGCPVHVPATVDAAALGAAIQGGVAAGWWNSAAQARSSVSLPTEIAQPAAWGADVMTTWQAARPLGEVHVLAST